MNRRVACSAITSALLLLSQAATADAMSGIIGRWRDSDGESEIEISRCAAGLCGKIVWLKEPRLDSANPDPAKKLRSLLGVQVLSGFKPSAAAARLAGTGYNPADGRSYETTLELKSPTTLLVKGCVLGGLICDDDLWARQQ